jgi:predicted Zn-dependent protease
MTDLREAAQQALEALEGGGDSWRMIGPAIDALKAALAEEALQRLTDANQEIEAALEQEPVPKSTWQKLYETAIDQRNEAVGLNQELLHALKDANDAIEHWGAYASDYFQQKWDLQSDINAARAAIARAEGQV